MTKRKWIALAVTALIGAFALWYFLSPLWTLNQIRSAAEEQNPERLSAYVDFPALREDLKAELTSSLASEMERDPDGLGGVGAALGIAIMNPMIDNLVSPVGLKAAFGRRTAQAVPPAEEAAGEQAAEAYAIERSGFNEFRVSRASAPDTKFVFRRDGLGWKLVGMDLPPPPAMP